MKRRWSTWMLCGWLVLTLAACNAPRDKDSYGDRSRIVPVTLALHGANGTNGSSPGPAGAGNQLAQLGSALVYAVPSGTPLTPYIDSILPADIKDRNLIDLGTSTVSLNLPLGVPLQLHEYTYNDSLGVNEIINLQHLSGPSPNISSVFQIDSEYGVVEISLPLNPPVQFTETTYSGGFDPLYWDTTEHSASVSTGTLSLSVSGKDKAAQKGLRPTDSGLAGVGLTTPQEVTFIQADVTVTGGGVLAGGGLARARLAGYFFHAAGVGGTLGDALGDVYAEIAHDGTETKFIVGLCAFSPCSINGFKELTPGFVTLSASPPVAPVTMSIDWDGTVFTFNDGAATVTFNPLTDVVSPESPVTPGGLPNSSFKIVGVRASNRPGDTSSVAATFNNVTFGNASAGPFFYDFDGSTGNSIDRTLWDIGESSTTIVGTDIQTSATADYTGDSLKDTDGVVTNVSANRNLELANHSIQGTVQVDTSLPADNDTTNATPVRVRTLAELTYQPKSNRSSGSTYFTGVRVQLEERGNDLGTITPSLYGFVCQTASCPTTTPGFGGGTFTTTPVLGTPYTFSLGYFGDGLFLGEFAGEYRALDMKGVAGFSLNSFIAPRMRSQTRSVFDPTDTGTTSATWGSLQMGQDVVVPTQLSAMLPLFEDFASSPLDPAKWDETEEYSVAVVGNALQVSVTEFQGSFAGRYFSLPYQSGFKGLRATVNLTSVTGSSGGASLLGRFYSDGTGDIEANISIDSSGGANYNISRCTAPGSCANLYSGSLPGGVILNTPYVVDLVWDGATGFTFVFDGGTPTVVDATGLAPNNGPPTDDPDLKFNTFASGGTTVATFDDVEIDADGDGVFEVAPYDDFPGPTIDTTLWDAGESSLQVVSGTLRFTQTNSDEVSLDILGTNPADAVSVDVTVNSASGDGRAVLGLGAYGSGNDLIFATIGLDADRVDATVVRCEAPGTDSDCSNFSVLYHTPLALNLSPGLTHNLFVQWTGSAITYQLDSDPPIVLTPSDLGAGMTTQFSNRDTFLFADNLNELLPNIFSGNGSIDATFDNVQASYRVPVDMSVVAPLPPLVTTPAAQPYYTNSSSPSFSGTCLGNLTHTVNLSGTGPSAVTPGTTPCAGGSFSFTVAPVLEGTYSYVYSQTDDGRAIISPPREFLLVYDTTPPGAPAISSPPSSPVYTTGSSLSIDGVCDDFATVNLTGAATQSVTCTGSSYSFTVTRGTDGTSNYSVNQTDRAGNTSPAASLQWIRDTATPAAPVISAPIANPFYTTAGSGTITFSCENNATVALSGSESQSGTCSAGTHSFTVTLATDATYNYSIIQTDRAGNTSSAALQEITKDTAAPLAPTITSLGGTPYNASNGNWIIGGVCETNATVNMTAIPGSPASTTCVSGSYSFNISETANDTYTYTVNQTDFAGNLSFSATQVVILVNTGLGITFSTFSLSVTEGGASDSFTVVLESQPNGDVVLDVVSSDTGEATVDKATLTFTTGNWDTSQTVTVSPVSDGTADGNQNVFIDLSINGATADTTGYSGISPNSVSVTVVNVDGGTPLGSTLTLYDDFTSPEPDPGFRWRDSNNVLREIVAGELILGSRADANEGIGSSFNNQPRIFLGPITNKVEAKITLKDYQNTGGRLRALVGLFYQPVADRGTGDANLYGIRIGFIDSGSGPQIAFANFSCNDDACSPSNTMPTPSGNVPTGQAVPINQSHTFSVQFVPGGGVGGLGQFVLAMDAFSSTIDVNDFPVSALVAFDQSNFAWAGIRSQTQQMDQPGDQGYLVLGVDDVVVDGALHDDFNTGTRMDFTKWEDGDWVKENRAGALNLAHGWADGSWFSTRNSLSFRDPASIHEITADVTVTQYVNNTDGSISARILGTFFNDGTSTGSGDRTGEINAGIHYTDIDATYFVSRCTDASCSATTTLTSGSLGTVALGETHQLYLDWDELLDTFTFQLDGNTPASYQPGLTINPAASPYRALRTQFRSVTTGEGYIAATFDNVRTGPDNVFTFQIDSGGGFGPLTTMVNTAVPYIFPTNFFGLDPLVASGGFPDGDGQVLIMGVQNIAFAAEDDFSCGPSCEVIGFNLPADFDNPPSNMPILGTPVTIQDGWYELAGGVNYGGTNYVVKVSQPWGSGTVTFTEFSGLGGRAVGSYTMTMCEVLTADVIFNEPQTVDCGSTFIVAGDFDTVWRNNAFPEDDREWVCGGTLENPEGIWSDGFNTFSCYNANQSSYYQVQVEGGGLTSYTISVAENSGQPSPSFNLSVYENSDFATLVVGSCNSVAGTDFVTCSGTPTGNVLYIKVDELAGNTGDINVIATADWIDVNSAAITNATYNEATGSDFGWIQPEITAVFDQRFVLPQSQIQIWDSGSNPGVKNLTLNFLEDYTFTPGTFNLLDFGNMDYWDGSSNFNYTFDPADPGTITLSRYDNNFNGVGFMEGSYSANMCLDGNCGSPVVVTGNFKVANTTWTFWDDGTANDPRWVDSSSGCCDEYVNVEGSSYYVADVSGGISYTVELANQSADGFISDNVALTVYDNDGFAGTELCPTFNAGDPLDQSCTFTPSGGQIYIRLDYVGGGAGSTAILRVYPTPTTLTLGVPFADTLANDGDQGIYQFNAASGQSYTVNVAPSFGGINQVVVKDLSDNWINSNGGCCGGSISIIAPDTGVTQTLVVQVDDDFGDLIGTDYTIEVTANPTLTPNSTPGTPTAASIADDGSYTGFQFSAAAGQSYTVHLEPTAGDVSQVEVMINETTLTWVVGGGPGTPGDPFNVLILEDAAPRELVIRVIDDTGTAGGSSFNIEVTTNPTLTVGSTLSGEVIPASGGQNYQVAVAAGSTVTVNVTPTSLDNADGGVDVYDATEAWIGGLGICCDVMTTVGPLADPGSSQTYYIRVFSAVTGNPPLSTYDINVTQP